MDLIDRYINEVGRRLPKRIRQDVETELHSLLMDSLEDHLAGENPENVEVPDELQIAVLKEFGPPQHVAQQYNPQTNYIIGPRLFEPYLLTLAVVLGITFVAHMVGLLTFATNPKAVQNSIGDAVAGLIQSLQAGIGSITLVFALIERAIIGSDSREETSAWDPKKMSKIADHNRIKLSGLILETVFITFLLGMVNFYPDRIGLSFVQIGGELKMTSWLVPDFHQTYGRWLSGVWFLSILLNVAVIWQGRWQRISHLLKAGLLLAGAYIFYRMAVGQDFVVTAPGGFIGEALGVPDLLNGVVSGTVSGIVGLVAFIQALPAAKILYRLFQPKPLVIVLNRNNTE
jgi:hypothetical protein